MTTTTRKSFKPGDLVTATMDTETLTAGTVYGVIDRYVEMASDGPFYTYDLVDSTGATYYVRNGHILLTPAA